MRRPLGLLISACALSARAFLIPAGLAPSTDVLDVTDTFSTLSFDPTDRIVHLPLPSCALRIIPVEADATTDESPSRIAWVPDCSSSLVLEFTVSEDGERLLLNSETVYPLPPSRPLPVSRLHVSQLSGSSPLDADWSVELEPVSLKVTGMTLTFDEHTAPSENGDRIIPVTVGIVALEGEPVMVDDVFVRVLRTGDGELLILEATHLPRFRHVSLPPPPPPPHQSEDLFLNPSSAEMPAWPGVPGEAPLPLPDFEEAVACTGLCRLKSMIGSRIKGFQHGGSSDCHHRTEPHLHEIQRPSHGRLQFLRPSTGDEPRRHQGRPHHVRPHGSYHHGHPHHHRHHQRDRSSFLRGFTRGFAAIVIPTMAGVAVGMGVSMLGLTVGRLITFLWCNLVRGGRRGNASASVEDDVHKRLLADGDEDPPPVYEEAPAYEEIVAEPK